MSLGVKKAFKSLISTLLILAMFCPLIQIEAATDTEAGSMSYKTYEHDGNYNGANFGNPVFIIKPYDATKSTIYKEAAKYDAESTSVYNYAQKLFLESSSKVARMDSTDNEGSPTVQYATVMIPAVSIKNRTMIAPWSKDWWSRMAVADSDIRLGDADTEGKWPVIHRTDNPRLKNNIVFPGLSEKNATSEANTQYTGKLYYKWNTSKDIQNALNNAQKDFNTHYNIYKNYIKNLDSKSVGGIFYNDLTKKNNAGKGISKFEDLEEPENENNASYPSEFSISPERLKNNIESIIGSIDGNSQVNTGGVLHKNAGAEYAKKSEILWGWLTGFYNVSSDANGGSSDSNIACNLLWYMAAGIVNVYKNGPYNGTINNKYNSLAKIEIRKYLNRQIGSDKGENEDPNFEEKLFRLLWDYHNGSESDTTDNTVVNIDNLYKVLFVKEYDLNNAEKNNIKISLLDNENKAVEKDKFPHIIGSDEVKEYDKDAVVFLLSNEILLRYIDLYLTLYAVTTYNDVYNDISGGNTHYIPYESAGSNKAGSQAASAHGWYKNIKGIYKVIESAENKIVNNKDNTKNAVYAAMDAGAYGFSISVGRYGEGAQSGSKDRRVGIMTDYDFAASSWYTNVKDGEQGVVIDFSKNIHDGKNTTEAQNKGNLVVDSLNSIGKTIYDRFAAAQVAVNTAYNKYKERTIADYGRWYGYVVAREGLSKNKSYAEDINLIKSKLINTSTKRQFGSYFSVPNPYYGLTFTPIKIVPISSLTAQMVISTSVYSQEKTSKTINEQSSYIKLKKDGNVVFAVKDFNTTKSNPLLTDAIPQKEIKNLQPKVDSIQTVTIDCRNLLLDQYKNNTTQGKTYTEANPGASFSLQNEKVGFSLRIKATDKIKDWINAKNDTLELDIKMFNLSDDSMAKINLKQYDHNFKKTNEGTSKYSAIYTSNTYTEGNIRKYKTAFNSGEMDFVVALSDIEQIDPKKTILTFKKDKTTTLMTVYPFVTLSQKDKEGKTISISTAGFDVYDNNGNKTQYYLFVDDKGKVTLKDSYNNALNKLYVNKGKYYKDPKDNKGKNRTEQPINMQLLHEVNACNSVELKVKDFTSNIIQGPIQGPIPVKSVPSAKWTSVPEAWSEIKDANLTTESDNNARADKHYQELFEAMAGIPSTELLYYSVGGSEFIVELRAELEDETAERTYCSHFDGTPCQYQRGDAVKGNTAAGSSKSINFYGDDAGKNIPGGKNVEYEKNNAVNPVGAASFNTTLNGHGTPTVYQAQWTGTISNGTSEPGEAGPSTFEAGKPGSPCAGNGYDPGNGASRAKADASPNWDPSAYSTALNQAIDWALQMEQISDQTEGTAWHIADSDGIKRIYHVGKAVINVSFTGGTPLYSNTCGGGPSMPAGSYTSSSATSADITSGSDNRLGSGWSWLNGKDGTDDKAYHEGAHGHGGKCPGNDKLITPAKPAEYDDEGNPVSEAVEAVYGPCGDEHVCGNFIPGVDYLHGATPAFGYTIKVTFTDGYTTAENYDGNEPGMVYGDASKTSCGSSCPGCALCGPCHNHDLPAIEDTWVQQAHYQVLRITDLHILALNGGVVEGTGNIRGGNTENTSDENYITQALITQGKPNLFFNVANLLDPSTSMDKLSDDNHEVKVITDGSEKARLRYSLMTGQDDHVYYAEETYENADAVLYSPQRSNHCDGTAKINVYGNPAKNGGKGHGQNYATGILYDNPNFGNKEDYHKISDPADKKTTYTNRVDSKDKQTEEWKRFNDRRNQRVSLTVISDFAILQTSSGDQTVYYYEKTSPEIEAQKNFDEKTFVIDKDDPQKAFDHLWSTKYLSSTQKLNTGGYNGNALNPTLKYKASGNGNVITTIFDNDATKYMYKDGLGKAKTELSVARSDKGNFVVLGTTAGSLGNETNSYSTIVNDAGSGKRPISGKSKLGGTKQETEAWTKYNTKDWDDPNPTITSIRNYQSSGDNIWLDYYNAVEADASNDPTSRLLYQSSSPSFGQTRLPRPTNNLRITEVFPQCITNPNGEYSAQNSNAFYYEIVNIHFKHNQKCEDKEVLKKVDEEYPIDNIQIINPYTGRTLFNRTGYALKAPYMTGQRDVNSIIVHDPISSATAYIVEQNPTLDQRILTDDKTTVANSTLQGVCSHDPATCLNRVLSCKFFEEANTTGSANLCNACRGKAAYVPDYTCSTCGNTGMGVCIICSGTGKYRGDTCPGCDGTGRSFHVLSCFTETEVHELSGHNHYNGLNTISVPGLVVKEFEGATWARVLYQDISGNKNYFTSANYLNVNSSGLFSALGRLDEIKADGAYEFMLDYPDSTGAFKDAYNRWVQTLNPLNQTSEGQAANANAVGYRGIHIDMPSYGGNGLERNLNVCVFDGIVNHGNWWLCCGIMNNYYSGTGAYTMPGPINGSSSGQGVSKCELWVRVNPGSTTGSIVSNIDWAGTKDDGSKYDISEKNTHTPTANCIDKTSTRIDTCTNCNGTGIIGTQGSPMTYNYTGGIQSVTLQPGTYKIEAWGAQGGNSVIGEHQGSGSYSCGNSPDNSYSVYCSGCYNTLAVWECGNLIYTGSCTCGSGSPSAVINHYHSHTSSCTYYPGGTVAAQTRNTGALGGYSSGIYNITSPTTLYITVGGKGNNENAGYNGGGVGYKSGYYVYSGGGGGATSVSLSSGLLSNSSVWSNAIIVAGGGAGASYYHNTNGAGGGTNGGNGTYSNSYNANGGTQTGGWSKGAGQSTTNYYSGGAGGGYYGGYTAYYVAGGGSGYINPILTNSATQNGKNTGNGKVIITPQYSTCSTCSGKGTITTTVKGSSGYLIAVASALNGNFADLKKMLGTTLWNKVVTKYGINENTFYGISTVNCSTCNGSGIIVKSTAEPAKTYGYTGGVQTVTLTPGTYVIEAWGAQGADAGYGTTQINPTHCTGEMNSYSAGCNYCSGGARVENGVTIYSNSGDPSCSHSSTYYNEYHTHTAACGDVTFALTVRGTGAKGGYSKGTYTITQNTTLYIAVGGQGNGSTAGYNGGGTGYGYKSGNYDYIYSGGGGGATSISLSNGLLSNNTVWNNSLLVAGGGAGGGYYGTNYGTTAGTGGGASGGTGTSTSLGSSYNAAGGTQTGGYSKGQGANNSSYGGAGGGGYYGGTTTSYNAGGGSGYISSTLTSTTTQNGIQSGNGKVVITKQRVETTCPTCNGKKTFTTNIKPFNETDLFNFVKNNVSLIPQYVDGILNPIWSCECNNNSSCMKHVCTVYCGTKANHTQFYQLSCSEPHHNGEHYSYDDTTCWSACNDDSKHKTTKLNDIDSAGKAVTLGNFIVLDNYFTVHYPNKGDFYQTESYGLSRLSNYLGKGYINDMDTTLWTREKLVKFPFAVLYERFTDEWEEYPAGEWIPLEVRDKSGTGIEDYHFYCPLKNSELNFATIEYATEAINAYDRPLDSDKTFWSDTATGRNGYTNSTRPWTNYNYNGNNDSVIGYLYNTIKSDIGSYWYDKAYVRNNEYNKETEDNIRYAQNTDRGHISVSGIGNTYHAPGTTYNTQKIDVIGRIGNLIVEDTDDMRYSNLFKNVKTAKDGKITWQVEGLIYDVDPENAAGYMSWYGNTDIRGLNIVTSGGEYTINTASPNRSYENLQLNADGKITETTQAYKQQYKTTGSVTDTYDFYNTYGTLPYTQTARNISLPLASSHNITANKAGDPNSSLPFTSLQDNEMLVGYGMLWDISTIGNYYNNKIKATPYFYALDTYTGELTPVDVYEGNENGYKALNYFGISNEYGVGSPTYNSYIEKLADRFMYFDSNTVNRRNISTKEKQATLAAAEYLSEYVVDADGNPVMVTVIPDRYKILYMGDDENGNAIYERIENIDRDPYEVVLTTTGIIPCLTPEAQITSTRYYNLGTMQELTVEGRGRTFFGSPYVSAAVIDKTITDFDASKYDNFRGATGIEVTENDKDTNTEPYGIDLEMYALHAQRWHLYSKLSSSSVFVKYDGTTHRYPMDKITINGEEVFAKDEIGKAPKDRYLILFTADIKAYGNIYDLQYSHDINNGHFTYNNQTYYFTDLSGHYTNQKQTGNNYQVQTLLGVYLANTDPDKEDYMITQTH